MKGFPERNLSGPVEDLWWLPPTPSCWVGGPSPPPPPPSHFPRSSVCSGGWVGVSFPLPHPINILSSTFSCLIAIKISDALFVVFFIDLPHSPLVFPSWCAIACHSQNFQPFAFIPKRQKRVLILADEWSLTACPCLAAGAAVRRIRAVRTHPRRHCPCRERPGPSIFQDRHGLFFKIEVFFCLPAKKSFQCPL